MYTTMFWRDALRLLWYSGITSQLNAFPWAYRPHHGLVSRVLSSTCCHCSPTVGTLQPVPVRDFADHVKYLHANDDYLFTEEYGVSSRTISAMPLISMHLQLGQVLWLVLSCQHSTCLTRTQAANRFCGLHFLLAPLLGPKIYFAL